MGAGTSVQRLTWRHNSFRARAVVFCTAHRPLPRSSIQFLILEASSLAPRFAYAMTAARIPGWDCPLELCVAAVNCWRYGPGDSMLGEWSPVHLGVCGRVLPNARCGCGMMRGSQVRPNRAEERWSPGGFGRSTGVRGPVACRAALYNPWRTHMTIRRGSAIAAVGKKAGHGQRRVGSVTECEMAQLCVAAPGRMCEGALWVGQAQPARLTLPLRCTRRASAVAV